MGGGKWEFGTMRGFFWRRGNPDGRKDFGLNRRNSWDSAALHAVQFLQELPVKEKRHFFPSGQAAHVILRVLLCHDFVNCIRLDERSLLREHGNYPGSQIPISAGTAIHNR